MFTGDIIANEVSHHQANMGEVKEWERLNVTAYTLLADVLLKFSFDY
jgi:hypothetical protein